MENMKLYDRMLVIVPHSDDEIILFGGLIRRAMAENKTVYVALVTNGDYEATTEEQGVIRPLETIAGLNALGLSEEQIIIMGYADTGMPKKESFIWNLWEAEDDHHVYPSHVGVHTYGPSNHPDFHSTVHGAPADYTKTAFRADIVELLQRLNPDAVFTTHPDDAHGDHAGLYQFVKELVGNRTLYTAFCHSELGDSAWPEIGDHFTCPPGLENIWETALFLNLTENEVMHKKQALEEHRAALKPDAVDYLRSFIKKDEIYFPSEVNK